MRPLNRIWYFNFSSLFDMRRPKSVEAVEPQRIAFESEALPETLPEMLDVVVPMVAVEPLSAVEPVVEAEVVDIATASRSGSGRRSGSRKTSGRRTKASKAEKVAEAATVEEMGTLPPVVADAELTEVALEEEEFIFPIDEEPTQSQIQPLFEPEPFVRMPRQGFGRRGRL